MPYTFASAGGGVVILGGIIQNCAIHTSVAATDVIGGVNYCDQCSRNIQHGMKDAGYAPAAANPKKFASDNQNSTLWKR